MAGGGGSGGFPAPQNQGTIGTRPSSSDAQYYQPIQQQQSVDYRNQGYQMNPNPYQGGYQTSGYSPYGGFNGGQRGYGGGPTYQQFSQPNFPQQSYGGQQGFNGGGYGAGASTPGAMNGKTNAAPGGTSAPPPPQQPMPSAPTPGAMNSKTSAPPGGSSSPQPAFRSGGIVGLPR